MLHTTRFSGFALSLATFTTSLTILTGVASVANADIFTDEQRREYLRYYAPIIMKRSHETPSSRYGHDWITNYGFDNDEDYSTNKGSWEKVDTFVGF